MILNRIMSLCEERNVPVSVVEKSTGLGNGTIRRWDVMNPRVDRLKLVADYFNVSVDFLLGADGENRKEGAVDTETNGAAGDDDPA